MRFGLWGLFALLLGAFAAHFILADRGYVLINFRGYVVEMSVPGLVLVLTALYLAIRGVAWLVRSPRWFRGTRSERRTRRSAAELEHQREQFGAFDMLSDARYAKDLAQADD